MPHGVIDSAEREALENEIAHLRGLDLEGLHARWHTVFRRRAPPHLPRHLLFRILAYRLQADRLGDLDADSRRLLGTPRVCRRHGRPRLQKTNKPPRKSAQSCKDGVRYTG